MCGIAGVLYRDPQRPPAPGVLEAMSAALAHRGPDGEGLFAAPGVGLVHRRLAIIDLEGGRQPLGNEDGSVQIVFNGEVYNYRELTAGLEARGHRFRTRSDTEAIVHLYEEVGEAAVERLRGMFAFAVWDGPRRRLLLARDRVGIKPLYVYRDEEKLVFGSELKAVLAHPGTRRELSPEALEDYLAFGFVPGPRSIFRHAEKLPPASVWSLGHDQWGASPRRYWRLNFEPDERPAAGEWLEAIRAKVAESAKLHLIADVPVGAFLSGGVDSSIVVGAAAGATQGALRTFSMGFEDEALSELPAAREIAAHFHTAHTEEVVTPDSAALLDELAFYYDEPFADSSAVPTYLVSRMAARHVKVVLSGDGGDEAFGGYRRYAHDLQEAAVRRRLPGWARRLLGPVARAWPKADWLPRPLRLKTLLTNLSLAPAAAYANTLQLCRPPLRRRLMSPELARRLNGHDPGAAVVAAYRPPTAGDELAGMIQADVATLLPDDYLVKVDRASMAHGLEARPPLLDHELLELAARVPSRYKVRGGQTKWALKEAFKGRLPPSVLARPKQGFEVPLDAWFRGPLGDRFQAAVLARGRPVGGLIDAGTAGELFRRHRSGRANHGPALWSLLVLAAWADRWL